MEKTKIFTLSKGITIGKTKHVECQLQQNDINMLTECYKDIQEVAMVPTGLDNRDEPVFEPQLLCNPQLMSLGSLRLRICKLGDLAMPLDKKLYGKLSETDLAIMQQYADLLDTVTIDKELRERGKFDSASASAE